MVEFAFVWLIWYGGAMALPTHTWALWWRGMIWPYYLGKYAARFAAQEIAASIYARTTHPQDAD